MRIDSITQAERDWHRSRRMFVFRSSKLIVAGELDDRGHREWFADEGWPTAYEDWVRGFYDDSGVYLYRGGEYRCDADVRFTAAYDSYLLAGFVPVGHPIFGGMKLGPLGQRWEPIELLGFVK